MLEHRHVEPQKSSFKRVHSTIIFMLALAPTELSECERALDDLFKAKRLY